MAFSPRIGRGLPKVGLVVTAEDECTTTVIVVHVVDLHVIWADTVAVGLVEAGLGDPSPSPLVIGALRGRKVLPEDTVHVGRETVAEESWLIEASNGGSTEEEGRSCGFDESGRHVEEGFSLSARGKDNEKAYPMAILIPLYIDGCPST